MAKTNRKTANRIFQREHKERLYNAGFKQRVIWIQRDGTTAHVTDVKTFLSVFRPLLRNVPKENRPLLFRDILSLTEYAVWQGDTHGK
jgi:hypothetical protein